jgi:hypothetical protein
MKSGAPEKGNQMAEKASIQMSPEVMAKVFNEWMRRYTEHPEEFEHQWQCVSRFLTEQKEGREPSYGEIATAYVLELLGDLSKAA